MICMVLFEFARIASSALRQLLHSASHTRARARAHTDSLLGCICQHGRELLKSVQPVGAFVSVRPYLQTTRNREINLGTALTLSFALCTLCILYTHALFV